MSEIYAMRRANGDWFALEDAGRIRVPLFYKTHDALMARLRNFGMLVFAPVALDQQALNDMADGTVDFCIINDPFNSLGHGPPITLREVRLLMERLGESTIGSGDGKRRPVVDPSAPSSKWWN